MSTGNTHRKIEDLLADGLALADPTGAVSISATACTLPATTVTSLAISGPKRGTATTGSLTTAGGSSATVTITATGAVTTGSAILVTVANGTNTGGTPVLSTAVRANDNEITAVIKNDGATAFNGTLVLSYLVI